MEDLEFKLECYRLRKRKRNHLETVKNRIKNFIMPRSTESTTINIKDQPENIEQTEDENFTSISDEVKEISTESTQEKKQNKIFKYMLWSIWVLFWVTLYIIAIELKFGLVYLMISALCAIYFNTRTGPKKENEISAYSVFNKNCEAIDGTLKAEQFERELFYAPIPEK